MKELKELLKITILIIGFSTVISCDEYVDLIPESPVSENYFNNEKEYEDALIGAYDMLQTTIYNVMVSQTASDDIIAGGNPATYDQPILQRVDKMIHSPSDNAQIQSIWNLMYGGMNRANYILEFKGKTAYEGKEELLAQVYFLRAYFAFELTKFFGDIPLLVEERNGVKRITDIRLLFGDQYIIDRVGSIEEVYSLIEEDLKEAIPNLPLTRPTSETYKITKGAAQALLGKIYVYHEKFAEAATVLNEVINSGEYQLLTGTAYQNLFTFKGENKAESVFEIQYTGIIGNNWDCLHCNAGNYAPQTNGPRSPFASNTYKPGWGINIVSRALYNEYESLDKRTSVTFLEPATGTYGASRENTGLYNKKYLVRLDEPTISSDPVSYQNNYRVIRYADVLLMAAEAEEQSGGSNAVAYLNQVRARAFGDNSHDYPYNGESNLLEAIYKERRLELAGEGHRFFDLVRTGKAKEAFDNYNSYIDSQSLTTEAKSARKIDFTVGKNEVFPIPLIELQLADALERWGQNPNY